MCQARPRTTRVGRCENSKGRGLVSLNFHREQTEALLSPSSASFAIPRAQKAESWAEGGERQDRVIRDGSSDSWAGCQRLGCGEGPGPVVAVMSSFPPMASRKGKPEQPLTWAPAPVMGPPEILASFVAPAHKAFHHGMQIGTWSRNAWV